MVRIRRLLAGAVVSAAVMLFGAPAFATNLVTSTGTGNSISVAGLTLTVTSCTYKYQGVNQTNCSVADVDFSATVSRGVATITFQSAATTTFTKDFFGVNFAAGSGLTDLNVTFSVAKQTGTSGNVINTLQGTMTGTVDATNSTNAAADIAKMSLGEGSFSGTAIGATAPTPFNLNLGSLPNVATCETSATNSCSGTVTGSAGSFTQLNFTGSNTFSINKDMKINAGTTNDGTLYNFTKVTQIFNTPEPASIGLLAAGLGGVAVLRRRRRRA